MPTTGGGASLARAAIVGVLVLLPARAATDESPTLDVRAGMPFVTVYGEGEGAEGVLRVEFANRGDRRVVVEDVAIQYLRGAKVLREDRPGEGFFRPEVGEREWRIERGARVDWSGVCLHAPPAGATRVRLEIETSVRRRLRKSRAKHFVEAELRPAPEPRRLGLPFRGFWRVTQGHGCGSHHRLGGLGGDYAWDFVALERNAEIGEGDYDLSRRNRDAPSFGRPIVSPVDGTVVRVVGGVEDNEGLREYPRRSLLDDLRQPDWVFGNYIVVEAGTGWFVLLAHLREGSVRVRPGDRVAAGQPIASCGNSGNSIAPHLHLQVMNRADPTDESVAGLPAHLVGYTEIGVSSEGEERDVLIRRVETGDPSEGSVIAPFESHTGAP